jgi:Uma2 family endonuclease
MHLWLLETFGRQFVNAEAPIDVSPDDNASSEPEPDLIVLKREFETFDSNPQPQDLDLVVEIADSSLNFDLTVKAALYARAAIAEYWVLDVAGKRLIFHRDPMSGTYTSVAAYGETRSSSRSPRQRPNFVPPKSSGRHCPGLASDGRGS